MLLSVFIRDWCSRLMKKEINDQRSSLLYLHPLPLHHTLRHDQELHAGWLHFPLSFLSLASFFFSLQRILSYHCFPGISSLSDNKCQLINMWWEISIFRRWFFLLSLTVAWYLSCCFPGNHSYLDMQCSLFCLFVFVKINYIFVMT